MIQDRDLPPDVPRTGQVDAMTDPGAEMFLITEVVDFLDRRP